MKNVSQNECYLTLLLAVEWRSGAQVADARGSATFSSMPNRHIAASGFSMKQNVGCNKGAIRLLQGSSRRQNGRSAPLHSNELLKDRAVSRKQAEKAMRLTVIQVRSK